MIKALRAAIGLLIGGFIDVVIYEKMVEWMPATIPIPGKYNEFTNAPIIDYAVMGIGEWIMFFLIFILPIIICIATCLLCDGDFFNLADVARIVLSLAAGIFTSMFLTSILLDWDLREFNGFRFGDYTFWDWMWLLFITVFPSGLSLYGSLNSSSWGGVLIYGVILPFVASAAICVAITTIVLMISAITAAPAFFIALLIVVLASATGTIVIYVYIK